MEFLDSALSFLSVTFLPFFPFFCWFVYKQIQFYVWKLPPGPIGLPFLGYVPFIIGKEVHHEFHRLIKIYGPLFSVSLGSYSAVVVSDYEKAKAILSHPASLARPPKFFDVLPEKGGFVGRNGDIWKQQRRLCTHALHKMGCGSGLWEKIIKKDVDEAVEDIRKFEGKPNDVSYELARSVRTSVMGLLLGKQFTEKETNPDVQVMERAFHVITQLLQTTNPTALMPWLLKYLVKFNIGGHAEKMKAVDEFHNLFRREIKERQNGGVYTDPTEFIGHYFEALSKKGSTSENETYTASRATVCCMPCIFVTGNVYLGLLSKEISSSPVVSETYEFRGYKIPKGTVIFANGWSIHHDPKYWDNPHLFVPERFMRTANAREKDPVRLDGYAPFSFGKRNCPGETVAIMTLFLYFAGLMQKFTIKSPPGLQVDISSHFGSVIYPKSQKLCFIRR